MKSLGDDYDLPMETMAEWSESYQRGYVCKRLVSIEVLLRGLIVAVISAVIGAAVIVAVAIISGG